MQTQVITTLFTPQVRKICWLRDAVVDAPGDEGKVRVLGADLNK
jgi:hypothetical protein